MKKSIQRINCNKMHLLMRFFLVIFFVCLGTVLYGQNSQFAPLNPKFVKFQNSLNKALKQNVGGHSLGLIPEPVLPNFAKTTQQMLKSGNFASKYDLRTAGPGGTSLLTSVKNQYACGACWTFATMGAIEGYAKKNGKGEYDLSENNLKECHGFVPLSCAGGNTSMSSAYLARMSGPVSEINDPYNPNIVGCKDNVYPEFWVSDIRYLPNDPSIIKQAILNYGALSTYMYMDEANCYNSTTHTYYSTGSTDPNHAVLLVGWDDTKITAGGTGAWIIKNSWGTSWGENGFFYISYNDTQVNTNVTSIRNINSIEANSTQFDYDKLGATNSTGYDSNIGYGLIRFSPGSKNYSIKQLSTYMRSGPGTVRFEVYDDFNGTTLSNLMGSISDQTCDLPGYYTFDLATPIQVNANNDFYIKVYYNTTGYNYPIPIEQAISGYANPVIESGKCWISRYGTSWRALGSDKSTKADLCIKAYGESAACTPPATPIIGTIKQPTCALATGSVVLSGFPATGTWTLTRTPGGTTTTGTGTSTTISGLTAGTYTFTVTNALGCTSPASANVVINAQPAICVTLNVYIEGSYDVSTGKMKTTLQSRLPLSQPYNAAPLNYSGTETLSSVPTDAVDWVLVELRQAASPELATSSTILAKRAAILKSNGSVVDVDGTSPISFANCTVTEGNNLYIVVRHRNHLAIMSATGAILNNGVYSYDFCTGLSQAYGGGNGYKQVGSKFAMVSGDVDEDGNIFVSDFNNWAIGFGTTNGYFTSDYDMDGNTFISDYNKWAINFGSTIDNTLKSAQLKTDEIKSKYSSMVPK
jgi:C1A family cysteine protease